MRYKGLMFAAAAAFAALPAMTAATAEPASPGLASQGITAAVTKVQYYGYPGDWGYGPYYGGGQLALPGDVIAGTAGVVGDILGGPYPGPYPRAGILACERNFRSFDPATGTYTTYSGEKVLCPYPGG